MFLSQSYSYVHLCLSKTKVNLWLTNHSQSHWLLESLSGIRSGESTLQNEKLENKKIRSYFLRAFVHFEIFKLHDESWRWFISLKQVFAGLVFANQLFRKFCLKMNKWLIWPLCLIHKSYLSISSSIVCKCVLQNVQKNGESLLSFCRSRNQLGSSGKEDANRIKDVKTWNTENVDWFSMSLQQIIQKIFPSIITP